MTTRSRAPSEGKESPCCSCIFDSAFLGGSRMLTPIGLSLGLMQGKSFLPLYGFPTPRMSVSQPWSRGSILLPN